MPKNTRTSGPRTLKRLPRSESAELETSYDLVAPHKADDPAVKLQDAIEQLTSCRKKITNQRKQLRLTGHALNRYRVLWLEKDKEAEFHQRLNYNKQLVLDGLRAQLERYKLEEAKPWWRFW